VRELEAFVEPAGALILPDQRDVDADLPRMASGDLSGDLSGDVAAPARRVARRVDQEADAAGPAVTSQSARSCRNSTSADGPSPTPAFRSASVPARRKAV
jgi:hypothetical protein